jgi:Bacterial regulatory proteins, lacI family
MPEATLKVVAKLPGVAPVTVSRVLNGSENVAAATREKILAIIGDLDYTPNIHAASLRRKRLNGESTSGSKDRLVCANRGLRAGSNSYVDPPSSIASRRSSYRIFGHPRLLMRGLFGARVEIGLATMAYNLKRVTNLLGATKLIEALHLA